MTPTAIGIDIGGTAIKGVHVDATGRVLAQRTGVTSPDQATLIREVRAVLASLQDNRPETPLGLATSGIAHPDGRRMRYCPGSKLDIEGLDWPEVLAHQATAPLLNDAQAALLGECWVGAARGAHHVVMLTLGTGVGGAVLADGRLLRGAQGRAGHLGHVSVAEGTTRGIVGTPGTLEDAIGEQTVTQRTDGRAASTADLVAAVRRHEPWAVEAWGRAVGILSRALASYINAFDPERVVLGGGIAQAGPVLFEPLREALARDEWRLDDTAVPVVAAELGSHAGAIGAARHALDVTR